MSLREQHAEATRERILAAVAGLLERGEAEDLTMPGVAKASGISLRTVYRYYPTRDELLEAAGRWIGDELLRHPYPETLDDVAELFRVGCRDFDEHPGLVRALALSQLGQSVRGYRRRERLQAIAAALRRELGDLPESELRRAEAVLAYLHNMLAYTVLRDESGLSGDEIGEALGWAIETLVKDLRERRTS
ncbi:MAG: TetR/AcrR family transcriptional regulator [Gaiellaceae bacterium]